MDVRLPTSTPFQGRADADLSELNNVAMLARIQAAARCDYAGRGEIITFIQKRVRRPIVREFVRAARSVLDDRRQALRDFQAGEKNNGGVHELCELAAEVVLEEAIRCLLDARPQARHQRISGRRIGWRGIPDWVQRFFRDFVEEAYEVEGRPFELEGIHPNTPAKRLHRQKVVGIMNVLRDAFDIGSK